MEEWKRDRLNISKFFPRRLSFSKICDILVAYLNAGADRDYIGLGDVANRSITGLHNISRNNNFLKSWGFVEEDEKETGKYKLTREAAEFASAYRIDPNGEQTRQMLMILLSKDEIVTKFVERINREGLDRNTILVELPRIVGDLRADKVGLNAFSNMIIYAFQIEELSVPAKTMKLPERPRTAKYVPKQIKKSLEMSVPMVKPQANLSITLAISPEVSPEKLKEYIKAVLEAYKEYEDEA